MGGVYEAMTFPVTRIYVKTALNRAVERGRLRRVSQGVFTARRRETRKVPWESRTPEDKNESRKTSDARQDSHSSPTTKVNKQEAIIVEAERQAQERGKTSIGEIHEGVAFPVTRQHVSFALSSAVKRGRLRRVSRGVFTLPESHDEKSGEEMTRLERQLSARATELAEEVRRLEESLREEARRRRELEEELNELKKRSNRGDRSGGNGDGDGPLSGEESQMLQYLYSCFTGGEKVEDSGRAPYERKALRRLEKKGLVRVVSIANSTESFGRSRRKAKRESRNW